MSLFDHAKGTIYQRVYQADDDKGLSVADMTYNQYNDWLGAATKALDRYLAGELTAEKAMAMICVHTKANCLSKFRQN